MVETSIPLKRCTKCKREFPATTEYFNRHCRMKDGFTSHCRICRSEVRKIERQVNGEAINQRKRELWNRDKATINAGRRERYANDLDYKKAIDQRNKEYSDRNVEKKALYSRKHYDLFRDKMIATARKHYQDNKPRKLLQVREYGEIWRKTITGRISKQLSTVRHRTRKLNLPNTLTTVEWQRAIDYWHGCCAVCGRQLKDLFDRHTIGADHWIPVSSSHCPGTIATNMIPLCHGHDGCNNSKAGKMPQIWLIEKLGKRKAKQKLAEIEAYFEWTREQT